MTRPKRKYVRLSPSTWAEISALWEIGDVTLPDLAERYSVHTRTLQAYFAKHKIIKGSKAAALATSVKKEIYSNGLGDKDLTIQRARETREAAYKNASMVEGLIVGTLNAMQNDPSKTLGLTSKLKALALAAAGLERLHDLKFRALGLDKDLPIHDEMPVLIIRDLSDKEITALQQDDDEDEAEPFVAESPKLAPRDFDDESDSGDDDQIVVEGDEQSASEGKAVLTDADGYRLAKGTRRVPVESRRDELRKHRSPIHFRSAGHPSALCSQGFFQGAIIHAGDHQRPFSMSALPPKADMCGATSDVRFGPEADMPLVLGYF